ncbi:MAG: GAF domain-containing protein [Candidatus Methylomirabilales bacterium]
MTSPDPDIQKVFAKSEELVEMLRKGKEFTDQLMKENERLRFRTLQLEKEVLDLQNQTQGSQGSPVQSLQEENKRLKEKLNHIEERFSEVEEENMDFATKYLEIQQQNENLANLYVASYQLHSTLDPDEVMEIVKEILINLVGAESFALYLLDKKTKAFTPIAAEEVPPAIASGTVGLDERVTKKIIESGEAYFAASPAEVSIEHGRPLGAVPLKIKREPVGLIALFKLLSQKESLAATDYELLNLLAGHAATAVVSSRLYADAERKLKTIEGFIELLKAK